MRNFIPIAAFAALVAVAPAAAQHNENPASGPVHDAEVATIAMDARMATAFEHIANQHDGRLRDLVALTQTAAPPFAESARGALFASMLTETGFGEATIDEVGNVIARRAGTSGTRTLMVAAHIDTVFPEATDVTVRVDGNRFAAPGIGDNTRGAILLLELASAIVAADLRTEADLVFVGNVGEEGLGDLRGTRHLFQDPDQRPDSFIAIDGGGPNRIINSAVGSNRYRVTYRGEGGHSWGDFGAANPHHAAARAIAGFAVTARPVTLVGPRSSFSVGRIGGGTSVNSIPFESWFEVDMRSGNPGKIATIDRLLREAVAAALVSENQARTVNAALTVEIAPIGRRPAGVGDPRSPLVQRAIAVLRAASIEPLLTASSTDANVPISLDIPAITISRCGTSGRAHSLDEFWIDDDDVIPCTIRALTLVLAEAGLAD